MNYKTLLTAFALTLCTTFAGAQSKLSIDNVVKAYIQNSGAIYQDGHIKGYFLFCQTDKIDRHTNAYSLNIMDQNLNKVKEIKFDDDKKVELLEAAYNGNALLFLFNDRENKSLQARIYDMDGNLKFTYSRPLDKRSEAFIQEYVNFTAKNDEATNQKVFSISDKGFGVVIPLKDGRDETYELDYYSSDTKAQYTYIPPTDGRFAKAIFLGATDSLMVVQVGRKEHAMSGQYTSSIVGVNFVTKKKEFELNDGMDMYKFVPQYCTHLNNSGNLLLMGSYYDKTANIIKDFSLGLAIYTISPSGQIVSSTYNSWSKDIGKYLAMNEKGKIDDIGFLFFHNIVQTQDGRLFAIGEGYKRVADGVGIAMNALSAVGGYYHAGGNTELKVTDMVILKFNPDFTIAGASIQHKNPNVFHTDYADFNSQHELALIMKQWGYFDYAFTTTDPVTGSFAVCYNDYERSKDYHGMTFHSLRYDGTKFNGDKIELKSKASNQRVLPGQPGYVMIYEYFRKDKRIDLRLEKLN